MAEVTRRRVGELQRGVFKILLDHAEGLPAKEIINRMERVVPPTEFERSDYRSGDLQGALADRVVFSGLETVTACENLCGDFRQCLENATLDGADRHAGGEIPATAIDVRLVPFKSGGTSAAAIVCLP